MTKLWEPMCASNADLDKLAFPTYVSLKLEGVRGEFTPDGLITRRLKAFNNKWLEMKFAKVLKYCQDNKVIIEGEFYKHGKLFSDINSICRRRQHPDTDDLEFWIFDCYSDLMEETSFERRQELCEIMAIGIGDEDVHWIPQVKMAGKPEVQIAYEDAISRGYEGLCFKHPRAAYKKGRSTKNEQIFLRIKPEDTFDGKVIEIIEMQQNLVESKLNELGRLSKHQDKDMKLGKGMAAVAVVDCPDFPKPVRVTLSRGLTDYDRRMIWGHKEQFIGNHLRFVGIPVAGMDLPRSPRFDAWRPDLD